MITVAQLIDRLKGCDPSLPVVVAGYEGGYNDISVLRPVRMMPAANQQWYYGAHEEAEDGDGKSVAALLLAGQNHVAKDG